MCRVLLALIFVPLAGCQRAPAPGPHPNAAGPEVPAPPTTTAGKPVCALLDPEKDPRTALLEAKLLADPASTWVERAGVDAVLKEQQVRAAFGPAGVGNRVRLGQLLKADVLVMVRPVQRGKDPALEVVVSETARGLRLLVRGVPVTKDAETDAVALLTVVREGIQKSGDPVREVVAVPPFVSQELTLEHDHLNASYARLVEGVALDRPGAVVVELAEAQALAGELALTTPGGESAGRPHSTSSGSTGMTDGIRTGW